MAMSNSKTVPHRHRRNIIIWLLQRISGAALVFLIGVHVWTLHYSNPELVPLYSGVVERLNTVGYMGLDISLLVMALFHGLNGVRNIVIDYTRNETIIRRWNSVLLIIGIVFSLLGSSAVVKILTMG